MNQNVFLKLNRMTKIFHHQIICFIRRGRFDEIYPDNEPIPVDHENLLQCHECGEIVPIYEIEKESSIRDVVETVDNPFDIGTSFLGIDSRSVGGKKARKKKERQRQLDDINDPDVKRELASGQIRLISYKES